MPFYAYASVSGEIVCFVWGRRDLQTASSLRDKLVGMGVSYDSIATDDWSAFISVFGGFNHLVGKRYTCGIEGNNCRLHHKNQACF